MSNEATYHDALVGHSRRSIGGGLTQTADAYALSLLGDVRGCTVIDLGCGRGSNSVLLAQRGAYVIACDISPRMLAATASAARVAGVSANAQPSLMSGCQLALPDACADALYGQAVLHHLDYGAALSEVRRVLRPGGRVVFCEPLAHNPLLRLYRALTPNKRTPDEHPLTWPQVCDWQHREFYLLALLAAPLRLRHFLPLLERLDNRLLRSAPWLRPWCWVTVLWRDV